jgi:C4-dicarboxylate-specific signal transduction histidine kinase
MPRSPRLGLRAQIVLALSLVFLLSFWLLGFATLQITRRNAVVERARAEQLLGRALGAQLTAADARSDVALAALCRSLEARVQLTGLLLLRADGTRFACGEGHTLHASGGSTLADGSRLAIRLPAPSEHVAESIANLLLFYMALTGLTVALLAYVLLTHLMVRPLERLTQSAEQLAAGAEHVSVKEQGSAEAVRLGRTFNEMAKQLRAERKQLTDRLAELERTTAELRKTERQLIHGEKLASVGRLAAGVAHEIGNPLTAVLGLLELLREGDLSPEQTREFLARIAGETERINGIIRDLLDFARYDAEGDERTQTADLRDVIRDAVSLVRPQKASKAIAIDVSVGAEVRHVFGPSRRLTQIVLNLLMNALDALTETSRPGRVEIRVQADPERPDLVSLQVIDDGPGLDAAIEQTLFEPFTTTKPVGKGTGLGLAVTHAIVDALGGTIEARNRSEGGACFEVRLRQVPASSLRAAG